MNRLSQWFALGIIGALFAGCGQAQPKAPNVKPQTEAIRQMELATINRINAIRRERGLKPLKYNPTLSAVARSHSKNMTENGFFAHTTPSGQTFADRVKAANLSYWALAENLAKNTNVKNPITTAVNGWMNSKGHRENIVREGVDETGLGIWKKGNTYTFTQVFANLR